MNTAILLFVAVCVVIAICDFIGWVREKNAARNSGTARTDRGGS